MPLTMFDPMVAPAPKMATCSCQRSGVPWSKSMKQEIHTSVAHLLPKFLPVGVQPAFLLWCGTGAAAALRHIQRHVAVVGLRLHQRRWWLLLLVVYNSNVAPRENAFQTGPFIASLGPVGIHELRDEDAILRRDSQITGIGGMVLVHCRGGRDGRTRCIRRWWKDGRGGCRVEICA